MDAEFWRQRWQNDEIGFHQAAYNAFLLKYWPCLELPPGARVLVPLCGKSRDMLWLLGQGHSVLGVELSGQALQAFQLENGLQMQVRQQGLFRCFEQDGLQLWEGDWFALTRDQLDAPVGSGISAVYDRAALIAFPDTMRRRYVRQMADLLETGAQILLITLEYDARLMSGPPFSVSEDEVGRLYGDRFEIELLDSVDVLQEHERFREKGLTFLQEAVYRLTRR